MDQISRRFQLAVPGPGPGLGLGLEPRDETKEVNQSFTQLGTHPIGNTIRYIKTSVVCDIVISKYQCTLQNFYFLPGCYLDTKLSPLSISSNYLIIGQ